MLNSVSSLKAHVENIDEALFEIIGTATPTLENLRTFTIESGGKRVRPVFCRLLCEAYGREDSEIYHLAAILEIIHAASLLHDDVIDEAIERRGRPSGKKVFGNKAVVLGGDYLLACGIHRLNQFEDANLMATFTHVIRELATAEIIQMENEQNLALTMNTYERIIYGKTAALFEAAGLAAGQYCELVPETTIQLGEFGKQLGSYFQIRDDILDYFRPELLKKPAYTDFTNGLVTYPLLLLKEERPEDAAAIYDLLAAEPAHRADRNTLSNLTKALKQSKVEELCFQKLAEIDQNLQDSLSLLPAGQARDMIAEQLKKLQVQ